MQPDDGPLSRWWEDRLTSSAPWGIKCRVKLLKTAEWLCIWDRNRLNKEVMVVQQTVVQPVVQLVKQHSTAQHSTAQHSTAQHITAQQRNAPEMPSTMYRWPSNDMTTSWGHPATLRPSQSSTYKKPCTYNQHSAAQRNRPTMDVPTTISILPSLLRSTRVGAEYMYALYLKSYASSIATYTKEVDRSLYGAYRTAVLVSVKEV
ncbi:MAG: hypothetical protein FRX49_02853 [Trebouxia sp. A1-2]|nr:MAG: hypothetical protein FRX49_02853 [Trebouxia sp. A1-2]